MKKELKKSLNYFKLDKNKIVENLKYTIPTIIFFLAFSTCIFTLSRLDPLQYKNSFLIGILFNPSFLISILISFYLSYKKITYKLYDKHTQYIIKACIILFTIVYTTYSYNYYYNSWHIIERFFLIVFGILAVYRLVLIVPFISYLCSIIYQFNYPSFLSYTWTDKILLIYVLILFVSYCLTMTLYNNRSEKKATLFYVYSPLYVRKQLFFPRHCKNILFTNINRMGFT